MIDQEDLDRHNRNLESLKNFHSDPGDMLVLHFMSKAETQAFLAGMKLMAESFGKAN